MLGALGALAAAACGGGTAAPKGPSTPDLAVDPLVDLLPAAGLVWLFDVHARELLANPALAPAVATLFPQDRFEAFAASHGGVDLRRAERLALADYGGSFVAAAETRYDAPAVEKAFAAHVVDPGPRVVEGGVTRLSGGGQGERSEPGEPGVRGVRGVRERQGLALLGGEALVFERGDVGLLVAVSAFARRKLHKTKPALHAEPLATAASLLGDAPFRAFAAGPFTGEWAGGLGGLLRATTAAGAAVRVEPGPALRAHVVLTGAWGTDAPAAAERLGAAVQLLATDSLGRLLGLDHPLEDPKVSGAPDALRLEFLLDPVRLARGLHAATDAKISEVMAY
jgi:hypothetical protein